MATISGGIGTNGVVRDSYGGFNEMLYRGSSNDAFRGRSANIPQVKTIQLRAN